MLDFLDLKLCKLLYKASGEVATLEIEKAYEKFLVEIFNLNKIEDAIISII